MVDIDWDKLVSDEEVNPEYKDEYERLRAIMADYIITHPRGSDIANMAAKVAIRFGEGLMDKEFDKDVYTEVIKSLEQIKGQIKDGKLGTSKEASLVRDSIEQLIAYYNRLLNE